MDSYITCYFYSYTYFPIIEKNSKYLNTKRMLKQHVSTGVLKTPRDHLTQKTQGRCTYRIVDWGSKRQVRLPKPARTETGFGKALLFVLLPLHGFIFTRQWFLQTTKHCKCISDMEVSAIPRKIHRAFRWCQLAAKVKRQHQKSPKTNSLLKMPK